MSATTHATRAEDLADLVRRARKSGLLVRFDHDGLVVLENPKDAHPANDQAAQPGQEVSEPAPGAAP